MILSIYFDLYKSEIRKVCHASLKFLERVERKFDEGNFEMRMKFIQNKKKKLLEEEKNRRVNSEGGENSIKLPFSERSNAQLNEENKEKEDETNSENEKIGDSVNKDFMFTQINVKNKMVNFVTLFIMAIFLVYFSTNFIINFN